MPRDLTLDVQTGSLDVTSMRYHELGLQKWLYSKFFVRQGYPVPVVFATPMDAFSLFKNLWAQENNPFAFLFNAVDENGTPLYEPHPSPARYPIISVMRQGVAYRSYQNFSIHRFRHINWPTVSDTGEPIPGVDNTGTGLTRNDLGWVTTSRMPQAFDYRFQIDFMSLRPDTIAFFQENLIKQFWRTGGVMQTWLNIDYPGWGTQYVRMYVDGDINNIAPDEAAVQDKNVEFRLSFTLVIEGFSVDVDYKIEPALWKFIIGPASLSELDSLLIPKIVYDGRATANNLVMNERPDIPAEGTLPGVIIAQEFISNGTVYIAAGDQVVPGTYAPGNLFTPNNVPVALPTDAINVTPQWSYGIPSNEAFGTPTFYGTVLV